MKGRYGAALPLQAPGSAAEQTALMDFRFTCITRFRPCESEARHPAASRWYLDKQKFAAPTR